MYGENRLFDLYGTLLDTHTDEERPELWEKLADFLAMTGAEYSPEALRRRYLGLCAEETEALAARSGFPAEEVEIELRDVFRRLYSEKGVQPSSALIGDTAVLFRALSYLRPPRLMPNALRVLDELRGRGLGLYLLSNAQSCFTVPELRRAGLYGRFDGVFLSSDLGFRKPSRRFYEKAMELAGISAQNSVMVGNDPEADIRGAAAVGLRSRYIRTWHSPPESGVLPESCVEIKDLSELL